MSASEEKPKKIIKKCCRWSAFFGFLALIGLTYAMASSTAAFQEQKRIWLQRAIHNVQSVQADEIYTNSAYLSANQLSDEFRDILFEEPKVEHESVRGIYVTAHTAASDHLWTLMDALQDSGGNAVVIDIELSGGQLAFIPESAYLTTINPGSTKLADLKSIIKELHRRDIYVIARQVVFNDPYTVGRKPEWGIYYSGGGLYDYRWLDPSRPEAQEYNLLITRELARLGFDEVQYDYIRFPDGYHYGLDYYYDESQKERWEVINDFMAKAHEITQEYDMDLGMDVFGATIYGNLDWTLVGQNISELAKNVDVIYPMTYPSHISPGYNGFHNPYGDPYSFIYDAIGKFQKAAAGNAEIRTWVQGFPLRIPNYGSWFVEEQVRGTYDGGARGFVVWSPGNIYTTSWSSLDMIPPKPPESLGEPMRDARQRVTKKPFGLKVSPQDSPVSPERFSGYHTGTDFEILPGEENTEMDVLAICDGPLAIKRNLNGYGGVLIQRCTYGDDDITVLYGHLDLGSIIAESGDTLTKGEKIALLGKGNSPQTDDERKHLHLGIRKGREIDFLGYVPSEAQLSAWLNPLLIITEEQEEQ